MGFQSSRSRWSLQENVICCLSSYSVVATSQWGTCYHRPRFSDEKTKAQLFGDVLKGAWLGMLEPSLATSFPGLPFGTGSSVSVTFSRFSLCFVFCLHLTWWMWVWVNSRSWWWTGRPGVLRFMGSQRVRHYCATELNPANAQKAHLFPIKTQNDFGIWLA